MMKAGVLLKLLLTSPNLSDGIFWLCWYLTTGMRKSELLNATWNDVDFEEHTIDVQTKGKTKTTCKWRIKGSDHRTLPLTEEHEQKLGQTGANMQIRIKDKKKKPRKYATYKALTNEAEGARTLNLRIDSPML